MYRKISLILLSVILLVVAVMLLVPYFFKDRITSSIESYIDNKLKYETTFSSRLTFARHFPDLSLILNDVVVSEGENVVAQAERVDIVMGLPSIFKNKKIDYKEVIVRDGYIDYSFNISGVEVELFRVDLSMKSDLSDGISLVKADININELFLTKDSTIFLDGKKISSKAKAEIDTKNKRAVLAENYIDLNGLLITVGGEVGYTNAGLVTDISFKAEEQGISTLLKALVPAAIIGQFEGSGLVSVNGSIVGNALENKVVHPRMLLEVDLLDGGLKYIDEHGGLMEFNGTGTLDVEPYIDSINVKYDLERLLFNGIEAFEVTGTSRISSHSVDLDSCFFRIFGGTASVDGHLAMGHGDNPTLGATMSLKEVDLAASIKGIPAIKKYVPSEQEINGIVDLDVDFKSFLGNNLSLIPESIVGNGRIISDSISVKESVAFENMKRVLQLGDNYTSTFHGIDIKFSIASGMMSVEPFTTNVGNLKLTVSGNHSLDNTLNYLVKTDMPRSDLGSSVNSLINLFSGSMSAFGIKVPIDESIKMDIKITGSSSKPVITPQF